MKLRPKDSIESRVINNELYNDLKRKEKKKKKIEEKFVIYCRKSQLEETKTFFALINEGKSFTRQSSVDMKLRFPC